MLEQPMVQGIRCGAYMCEDVFPCVFAYVFAQGSACMHVCISVTDDPILVAPHYPLQLTVRYEERVQQVYRSGKCCDTWLMIKFL